MDPNFALARATLGFSYQCQVTFEYTKDRDETEKQACQAVNRAVALDKDDAETQVALGLLLWSGGEIEDAVSVFKKAVELNPSHATARSLLGMALGTAGRAEEGIVYHQTAIRLSPRDTFAIGSFVYAGAAFGAGLYEQSVEWAKKTVDVTPDFPGGYRYLAGSLHFWAASKKPGRLKTNCSV